jgi:predicted pyridoxine 5'-phosphate oxidase superfamily flavin-nucleotide-binding protein
MGEVMSQQYHEGQRALQDRFDTRRLADRLDEATTDEISDAHRRFIESRDMFFLATADPDGLPQCSYKGGDPGFVRVVDAQTVAFPVYDGNGMFLSMGNVGVNPNVGMLFMDFALGTRLRFNGVARIEDDDPLLASYPGAQLVVRVRGQAVFANCRRYVHHYELVERSPFVPSVSGDAPVPDWKLDPWFEGTLPEHDPARDPDHPTAPAIPQF